MSIEQIGKQFLKHLETFGPDPQVKEKLMLFGQFVGDWDIVEARYPQADGTEIRLSGEVRFGWVLDGRAIQDVWITHHENPPRPVSAGTTIRFYDPKINVWHCIWVAPPLGIMQTFVARDVDSEIVLEGTITDGYPERWIFSEITRNSFHWRSIESNDDMKTWRLTEEMRIERR